MPLLITVLVVVRDVFVLVLKGAPAVEVVPEIVEALDVLFGALLVAEPGHRLRFAKATFTFKDGVPELVEAALLGLFLRRRFDVCALVDRVELPAADWVEEDLGGFLDAFEKGVVFGVAGRCFLVRVVAEDLLSVGTLDLVFCSLVAVLGQAEDRVMVLSLDRN